jgi:hypothetical protein
MRWRKYLCLLAVAVVLVGLSAPDALAKKKKGSKEKTVSTSPLDDGNLIPSWYNPAGLAFVETEEIDYLWVREGFNLSGHTLHMAPWSDPEFLGEAATDRDGDDKSLARRLTGDMPNIFRDGFEAALGSSQAISLESGDIKVTGRIVDCSTGNVAAKAFVGFGAGAGNVTFDLKMTDAKSGELVLAMHHRVVSGTNWSTTDSKFIKWVRKAAEELTEDGAWALYQDGDSVKK